MILDKRTILSLALADLCVIGGAFYVLRDRYRLSESRADSSIQARPSPRVADRPTGPLNAKIPALPSPASIPPPAQAAARPGEGPKPSAAKTPRRILFTYRNSKPSRVEIVGTFNNWEPRLMDRGDNHLWSATLALEPGDYTYNFLVDGRAIRDPNNPRTAPEGRSLLTVKSLSDPH